MNRRPLPLALTVVLLALSLAPTRRAPGWMAGWLDAVQARREPSASELERIERGYYERLTQAPRLLDEAAGIKPAAAPSDFGPLTLPVADVREYVLKPSLATTHRGATWSTNALGCRDREYSVEKPPGTFRIVLVGDSIGAGWGVNDEQGFEPTWERVLRGRRAVEVWNLAVPGHAPGQRAEHLAREGWRLAPDLVIFQGSPADYGWDDRKLRSLLPRGVGWEAAAYRRVFEGIQLRPGGDEDFYKKALKPHRDAVLQGVYCQVVEEGRRRGVPCVWLLLPRVGKTTLPEERKRLVSLARASDFSRLVDLSDSFDGIDPATLAIGPDDFHPNAFGHARLAARLDEALAELRNGEGLSR